MEVLFLVAQAALLILAGVMVLRVREELQLLVRQADPSQKIEHIRNLQNELHETLREVRATLNEGIAKLEERIARAEQVLHALEAHVPNTPPEVAPEPNVRVPVERILALADSGCDVREIARLTGASEGEVQLILQIRAQRLDKESSGNSVQRNERTEE